MAGAYQTSNFAYQGAGQFAYQTENVAPPESLSGGYFPDYGRIRTPEDVRLDRVRFGVIPDAAKVIESVALRQSQDLHSDEQRRFDELRGELALQKIEWQAGYLEALNAQREALIDAEIARRIKALQQIEYEDQVALLLVLAASL